MLHAARRLLLPKIGTPSFHFGEELMDILERLRKEADYKIGSDIGSAGGWMLALQMVMSQAADEIERLRKEAYEHGKVCKGENRL